MGVDGQPPDTGPESWRAVHDRLVSRENELDAADLTLLADACFWLNQPRRSIEVLVRAHRAWLDADRRDRAARAAWRLFYEHWLVGESVVARGWLTRARRLVPDRTSIAGAWLVLAEVDVTLTEGDHTAALGLAAGAVEVGMTTGDDDLRAMALQAEGRCLLALDRRPEGLARLDEAMIAVIGDELSPLYTGWIYCNVIATCHAVGDLRRANEWSEAGLRWCASLRDGLLYPGLCRVYAAELAQLRGEWAAAERAARQACTDLATFDRRYAGAAHYVVGESCRLQGRVDEALAAYDQARDLGRTPQPGLALAHAAQGGRTEALAALLASVDDDAAPLARLQQVEALADVAEQTGDTDVLGSALARLLEVADTIEGDLGGATAAAAQGRLSALGGEPTDAVAHLRRAVTMLDELRLPYQAARTRLRLARAAADAGDPLTARLEQASGEGALRRLGATVRPGAQPEPEPEPEPASESGLPTEAEPVEGAVVLGRGETLTDREREVLALVARGLTNRETADRLHLSPHTVARHLANCFAKLGVRTRAGAVASAYAQGLLTTGQAERGQD